MGAERGLGARDGRSAQDAGGGRLDQELEGGTEAVTNHDGLTLAVAFRACLIERPHFFSVNSRPVSDLLRLFPLFDSIFLLDTSEKSVDCTPEYRVSAIALRRKMRLAHYFSRQEASLLATLSAHSPGLFAPSPVAATPRRTEISIAESILHFFARIQLHPSPVHAARSNVLLHRIEIPSPLISRNLTSDYSALEFSLSHARRSTTFKVILSPVNSLSYSKIATPPQTQFFISRPSSR